MPAAEITERAIPPAMLSFRMSWPLVFALATFLGIIFASGPGTVLADPDTYWHIATGRWIIDHGAVPKADIFSHTMAGAPWTAHEWLSEVIFTGVFQIAGWTGLVALAALAFAGALACLSRFLLARMEPAHAVLFTGFAANMMLGHLLARPHVLVWPLLALWVGALVHAGERQRPPPWWLLPLMTLWANLHGSFILGLVLAAALALDAVLAVPPAQQKDCAGRWGAFVALSVAAATATPAGVHGLWFPLEVMQMTFANATIAEWLPTSFSQFNVLEFWLLLLLAAACTGRIRLPWLRLALVLGLIHMALSHRRHVEILGLVAPFLLAAPLASQLNAFAGQVGGVQAMDRLFHALAARAGRGAIATSALVAFLALAMALHADRFAPNPARTPEAAVAAAMNAGVTGPVLNSYAFGGYLIFKGVPVFFDGRADLYGDAVLKRYMDALNLRDSADFPRLLDEYRIGWTLLQANTPAVAVLDRLPGWHRLHGDGVAVVHVRRNDPTAPGEQ